MENYLIRQTQQGARFARWHIQNAIQHLKQKDGDLSLAANSLLKAGEELYKAAIQARAYYERCATDEELGANTAEEKADALRAEIYEKYFKELEPKKYIEL